MPETQATISIVWSEADRKIVRDFAYHAARAGFRILSPFSIEGLQVHVKQPQNLIYAETQAIVVFASLPFFQDSALSATKRQLVDAFENEAQHILVVTTDNDWQRRDDLLTRALGRKSYETVLGEAKPGVVELLVEQVVTSIEDKRSTFDQFYNLDTFKTLTRSSTTDSQVLLDTLDNETSPQVVLIRTVDRRTTAEHNFLFVHPDRAASSTKAFVDEQVGPLTPSQTTIISPGQDGALNLTTQQALKVSFGCRVVTFESFLDAASRKQHECPPPIFSEEVFVPQLLVSDASGETDTSTADLIETFLLRRRTNQLRPMISILGGGGSGKTHFIGHLHDHLLQSGRTELYFFSGKEVEELLKVGEHPTVRSLYDVYKYALTIRGETDILSRDVFELRFKSAETFFFVDGIEELIGFLGPSFDQADFFNDCLDLLEANPRSTIVTSSRVPFVSGDRAEQLDNFRLKLFDEAQKASYYQRFFQGDPDGAKLAALLDRHLTSSDESNLPLFCASIAFYVERQDDREDLERVLNSKTFDGNDGLNFLLEDSVRRERRQGVEWDKDALKRALEELSIHPSTKSLNRELVENTFARTLGRPLSLKELGALERLIFLNFGAGDSSYRFRFQFMNSIFAAHYSGRIISNEKFEALSNERVQELFAFRLSVGTNEFDRLQAMLARSWPKAKEGLTYFVLQSSDLPGHQASALDIPSLIQSNLTALLLCLENAHSADRSIELVSELFGGSDGTLRGLRIVNFNQLAGKPIRIDFRDRVVIDSVFARYDGFWACPASTETKFVDCRIVECSPVKSRKDGTPSAQYSNCEMDDVARAEIANFAGNVASGAAAAEESLRSFLSAFVMRNNYDGHRRRDTILSQSAGRFSISPKKVVDALIQEGVLQTKQYRVGEGLQIARSERKNVRAFREDYQVSRSLSRVIDAIAEDI